MTAETIRLVIPHDKPFYGIARLVVGGLAARLDLSLEHLEDLQLALESVLENDAYAAADEVTLELGIGAGRIELFVGPLDGERLGADLEEWGSGHELRLSRVLAAVVESAGLEERADGCWLRLEKRIPE